MSTNHAFTHAFTHARTHARRARPIRVFVSGLGFAKCGSYLPAHVFVTLAGMWGEKQERGGENPGRGRRGGKQTGGGAEVERRRGREQSRGSKKKRVRRADHGHVTIIHNIHTTGQLVGNTEMFSEPRACECQSCGYNFTTSSAAMVFGWPSYNYGGE